MHYFESNLFWLLWHIKLYVLFTVGFYGPNDLTSTGGNFKNQEKHLVLIRIKANRRKYQSLGKQKLPCATWKLKGLRKAKKIIIALRDSQRCKVVRHNFGTRFYSVLSLFPLKMQRRERVWLHPPTCLVTLERVSSHDIMKYWRAHHCHYFLPYCVAEETWLPQCHHSLTLWVRKAFYQNKQNLLKSSRWLSLGICSYMDGWVSHDGWEHAIMPQLCSSLGLAVSEDKLCLVLPGVPT